MARTMKVVHQTILRRNAIYPNLTYETALDILEAIYRCAKLDAAGRLQDVSAGICQSTEHSHMAKECAREFIDSVLSRLDNPDSAENVGYAILEVINGV